MKTQWQIFVAFFRVGLLGYGGGPSSIPLVYKEVVERYKWMDDEEFGDIIALGNALPGPIITKTSGYIGYRIAGVLGMLNAIVSSCLPTILAMIILLKSLHSIKEFNWVNGMIAAVIPVVGMMMATLTWQFFSKAKQSLGWVKTIVMCIILFFLLQVMGIHPAWIIAVLLVIALVQRDQPKNEDTGSRGTGS